MSLIEKARELLTGTTEQQRASLADRLATARTELDTMAAEHGRLALAAEEGDALAAKRIEQLRERMAEQRQRIEHLQAAVDAHEARSAADAVRVKAANREVFEAEGRAALGEVKAAAVAVDARIAALADALRDWARTCGDARIYLNDEGRGALFRPSRYLETCIAYKLRGLPGIPGDPALTDERRETWAQHFPDATEWPRLIAKGN